MIFCLLGTGLKNFFNLILPWRLINKMKRSILKLLIISLYYEHAAHPHSQKANAQLLHEEGRLLLRDRNAHQREPPPQSPHQGARSREPTAQRQMLPLQKIDELEPEPTAQHRSVRFEVLAHHDGQLLPPPEGQSDANPVQLIAGPGHPTDSSRGNEEPNTNSQIQHQLESLSVLLKEEEKDPHPSKVTPSPVQKDHSASGRGEHRESCARSHARNFAFPDS